MQLKTNSFPKSKLKRWIKPILIFGVSLIGIGGVVILIALLSFGKSPSDAPGIFFWGLGLVVGGLCVMSFSDIIAWMCTFEIYFADQALGLTAIANNLDDIAEKLSNETNKEKK